MQGSGDRAPSYQDNKDHPGEPVLCRSRLRPAISGVTSPRRDPINHLRHLSAPGMMPIGAGLHRPVDVPSDRVPSAMQLGIPIMSRSRRLVWLFLAIVAFAPTSRGGDRPVQPASAPGGEASRVYGEWRIRVRPEAGPAYNQLIEQSGLPLFRAAGGRMVGWWNTLVGDLYEHVTIWEYDDMAAFEKAIQFLSKDPAFARFVATRDPLLAGEESRFLRLAPGAARPSLPEPSPFVVHEVHRVPLARRADYLAFMTRQGFDLLKAHGFRPAGPWVVDVGRWSEVTYLFRFESLAERERLIATFSGTADAKTYGDKVDGFTEEITTRLLIPAPFARATPAPAGNAPPRPASSAVLPHRDQLAPGVYAAGFSDRHHTANCGWVALGEETLLIDLPRGIPVSEFLALVTTSTGKPARTLVLTHSQDDDPLILRSLVEQGISRVLTSPETRARLLALPGAAGAFDRSIVHARPDRTPIGDAAVPVDFLPLDDGAGGAGGAAVHLPGHAVLFAGPLVVNGPRAPLTGRDTELWAAALRRLAVLEPARVVPGFGSWGGPELLSRQRRFLAELRRQVGYHIAQGRPLANLRDQVRLPTDALLWMPYDTPTAEDIESVYRELTVPNAPFHGHVPTATDPHPHALILIGDQPHEPGHIEDGLRPVFEAIGVVPHFTVDVNALSAKNLAAVPLLVILRDGLQRPDRDGRTNYVWMTAEQERAVVAFVKRGGGFLNLHNAMGLYPPGGPYLDLIGGRYIGHGPLERFQVEVVDPDHPVTRGVGNFFVADEQHTPPYDEGRVHLLLRNRSDDGKVVAAAGWVREPGRGRLCHLANGHTREALLHPMYQRLLRNGVRWCLRLEDSDPAPHASDSKANGRQ
jgi:type 1 glutamine amidotransferase